ncbi:GlmL-related ornithine degradation protein [Isachenkonia alkalipeptolytica]|uniref:DNA mismatch repair protein MutL n=1 Tax=Isachenkonia alkalipeptolytica TaxID=2565777 RepID=A0AA43XLX5_9CLOT|nr:GlmL-related ornithine degradation protein [Isachenkonia alkalipeptolytica]NBG88729.1 DNA mismatch repair protein MutL [Isachenkonia alkalipeptolytica]
MKINVLVAEIGSTTTVVNAFQDVDSPCPAFLGQGQHPTTVNEGDVTIGLEGAIDSLKNKLKVESIEYDEMLATSSAAGGLKMTVHGLVYDMTVRAAKEAALGAGANIHIITAGKLMRGDLKKIKDIKPNIILIAGGVDYGERATAIENAEKIANLELNVPIIYAGNVENTDEIQEIFNEKNQFNIFCVENVYPKIDELNVEPTRAVIQDVFEEHIIHAPGMQRVKEMINGPIIPTPGAVMQASKLLKEVLGDLVTFDVGGATTDLHSVTEGSEEINRILISPEPVAKRTVEGDLGVFVNMENIVRLIGSETLKKEISYDLASIMEQHKAIPESENEKDFVERLALEAVKVSLNRHAGKLRNLYGASGKTTVAEGKDLSNIQYVIGTGGALTRLPNRIGIIKKALEEQEANLLGPTKEVQILIDNYYIMASLGVLSKSHPKAALKLLQESLGLKEVSNESKN